MCLPFLAGLVRVTSISDWGSQSEATRGSQGGPREAKGGSGDPVASAQACLNWLPSQYLQRGKERGLYMDGHVPGHRGC